MNQKLGATGEFPNGKLNEDDEGEIQFGIAADKEKNIILIQFGKSVSWLGMNADEAEGLGQLLIQKANELRS